MTAARKKIDAIQNAKDVLLAAGFIPYYWHIEDIEQRDIDNSEDGETPSDLTDEELRRIAQNVADNADANYGISWETFDAEIETVKKGRKK